MLRGIHTAGGDFMKQRLPEMGAGTLDQRNPRLALGRQTVAKARYELQSPGPSAHDDNMVQMLSLDIAIVSILGAGNRAAPSIASP